MDYQKKGSNSPMILFIFFIILIVGTVSFIKIRNNRATEKPKEKEEIKLISREIEYTSDYYIYDIIQDNDNFEIIIKELQECDVEPCSATKIDSYKITDSKQISDLKTLFDNLFNNSNEKKLQLKRANLSIDDYSIIESVIREPEKEVEIKTTATNVSNCGIKTSGYKITEKDNKYQITISLGERNTGGYSVEITKMVVNQDILSVHVQEKAPDPGSIVTQAFTTPGIIIEINVLPKTIQIVDENDVPLKEIFEEKNKKTEEKKLPKETEDYTIQNSTNNAAYKQKGYYIDNNTITIASGPKNTGGYTIEVVDLKYDANETKIVVKETAPKTDATTIQAITYPIVRIEFKSLPNNLSIVDQNNNVFKEIK